MSSGSKFWSPSSVLNDKFGVIGRLGSPGTDKIEKQVERTFTPPTILGAQSPTTPDATFASPNDPSRRRVGNASGELSTMLGG